MSDLIMAINIGACYGVVGKLSALAAMRVDAPDQD